MTLEAGIFEGGCLCGRIRYRARGVPGKPARYDSSEIACRQFCCRLR